VAIAKRGGNQHHETLLTPDCDAIYLHGRASLLGVDELLKEVLASDE
jgi:hypothetical protein